VGLEGLQGSGADGVSRRPPVRRFREGHCRRRRGQARVRVIPPPRDVHLRQDKTPKPWWTALKTTIGTEGAGTLVRPRDETVGRRAKLFMGRPDWSNYTIEADVRITEQRRQRGNIGLINQRYELVLFGNNQALEIHPWVAADEMTVRVPFESTPNTWYCMKLRVENRPDGTALVRGKVWPTGQPEPAAWTIEKVDRIPLSGAPRRLRRRNFGCAIRQLASSGISIEP
jgi:hypothetical protein